MKEIIISKHRTKCPKCKYDTFKIQYKFGADPDLFFIQNNQLQCAYCGKIYRGEISLSKKMKLKLTEEQYKKGVKHRKKIKEFKKKFGHYPSEKEIKVVEENLG